MTTAKRILLSALVAAMVAAPSMSRASGTNLVVNPGFETSVLPAPVVAAAFNQPVLPVGWIAEGATVLFDHTPHNPHAGQYAAGISGSLSGPRHDCSTGSCVDVPDGSVRSTVYGQVYSVAPSWRTQSAIPVVAGTQYRFSTWTRLSIVKDGTGAVTRVRWVNANGLPVGTSEGPSYVAGANIGASYGSFAQGQFANVDINWAFRKATVTAPAGATGAILLLSYSDDVWNGQVVYDDVCFAPASTTVCG